MHISSSESHRHEPVIQRESSVPVSVVAVDARLSSLEGCTGPFLDLSPRTLLCHLKVMALLQNFFQHQAIPVWATKFPCYGLIPAAITTHITEVLPL